MNDDEASQVYDKMLSDMRSLIERIGLTDKQSQAALRMSEQLIVHANKLRAEHSSASVRRSVKTEIAALGLAAIHRATVHRANQAGRG